MQSITQITAGTALQATGSRVANQDARSGISKARRISLQSFAWFTLAYNVAVVLWGAYVRVTGSGAGCGSDWPLCNGGFLPVTFQATIEYTHRVTSGLSLILVVTLVIWSWRRTARGERPRYSATTAVILLFNEALLGAMLVVFERDGVDRSTSRAVFLSLHFGNTLLLVAALTLTARWLSNRPRRFALSTKGAERTVVAMGLFCVMATGMTGSLAALGDTIVPPTSLKDALVKDFSSDTDILLHLRTLHPLVAAVAVLYMLWIVQKLRKEHSEGLFFFATTILAAQMVLGVLNVLFLSPIWIQLTHLLVAEILWIVLVLASADLLFSHKHFNVPLASWLSDAKQEIACR